jgi:putative DNA primase/helicase
LIPNEVLRESVLKLDHHLDASNKDSIITAVCHWIVEIGELDSSFKKDIARLKGFLTADRDKVRRPYGKSDSEYPRRTVFCATVNDDYFLVDSTGNSRWWTIPVVAVNYNHRIDMQQVFAQFATYYEAGMTWWLTPEEEAQLELQNKKHRAISVIRERILDALNLDRINESGLSAMTATQVLQSLEIKSPTNAQSKEAASVLRELLGDSKRIQGINKWRIPFKKVEWESANAPLVSDDGDDF